jgi:uncharacterized protein (TIGR02453 family)
VATTEAPSFSPQLFAFLRELKQHNEREWFNANKTRYEQEVKEPALAFIEDMGYRLPEVAPHLTADKRSLFRIYRDTRFSKDKSPYKTHVAASFGWAGDNDEAAGRSHTENVHASGGYFHLQPGEIFVGGGVWHPDPSWLKAFRDRVVDDFDGYRDIVEAPAFRDTFGTVGDDGESLKRVPPGYPPDHPAADLLRKKNVTFGRRLADADAQSPRLPTIIAESFTAATPLLRYLATLG